MNRTLRAFVAGAMLAGCSGPPQIHGVPVPACRGDRSQAPQCGVLIQTGLPIGTPAGYAPADLQSAYNLPSSSAGSGQVVAVVDAYDNPNVASDLAAYRSAFGLPAADFHKYDQEGRQGHYPTGDIGWGFEIDLDVEMVSASCPNCTIDLLEANSNSWNDIGKATAEAVALGAHVVSIGVSGSGAKAKYFDAKRVTYLAPSGDSGSVGEPAAFDSVVAVGATTLVRGGGGKRGWTESVWSTSGGCTNQPKPPWQHDSNCAFRLANDVSAVGDPNTGVAEYDTYGNGGWVVAGGTSVPAPLLAGIFGLAGNAGRQDGGRTFWRKAHSRYLYRLESGGKYVRYSDSGGWGAPNGIAAF